MNRIWTADIEANKWIDFLVIGLFTGDDYKVFRSIPAFLSYVLHKRANDCRIYFHNGGNYDFLFLLNELYKKSSLWDRISWTERRGRLLSFTTNDAARVQFADSYALLPASLERLIEGFKVNYKKIPIDFSKDHSSRDSRLLSHLENDCRALYEVIDTFRMKLDLHKMKDLKLTIASQALHIFRTRYCESTLEKLRMDEETFRYRYYHGGRVEVYEGYGKNLYHYDVKSLFPYAMLEDQPVGMYRSTTQEMKNKIGFYQIEVRQRTNFRIAPFLVRTKKGNYFVNAEKGDLFYVSSKDLQLLRELGVSYRVTEGMYFDGREPLFNDYVSHFYEMKETTEGGQKEIAKFLLNAMYGKLGQARWFMKLQRDDGSMDAEAFDLSYGLVLKPTQRHSKFILPYLAAWVTSVARYHHYKLMMQHENSIYYCDTDSLFSSRKYETGNRIGDLDLKDTYREAVFMLPKSYATRNHKKEEKVVVKGFKSKEFTFDHLKHALESGRRLYRIDTRIMTFRESLQFSNVKDSERTILKRHRPFLYLMKVQKELQPPAALQKPTKKKKKIFDKRMIQKSNGSIFTSMPLRMSDISKFLEHPMSVQPISEGMAGRLNEWIKQLQKSGLLAEESSMGSFADQLSKSGLLIQEET